MSLATSSREKKAAVNRERKKCKIKEKGKKDRQTDRQPDREKEERRQCIITARRRIRSS